MTINNNSVVNNQTLQNDNVSGFNSSDEPTVTAIKLTISGSLVNADGATNVDPGTDIYIYFSEAMDNTSITAITSGTSCNSGTVRLSLDDFVNCIPMSLSHVSNTLKIFTFDPNVSNLLGAETYKITVTTGVKDASGIAMEIVNQTLTGFTVSGK